MKSDVESDTWKAAQTEYVKLSQNERQMEKDPDLVSVIFKVISVKQKWTDFVCFVLLLIGE